MANSKHVSGEGIGRPEPWGEGRYQQPGQPVEETVHTPPGTVPNADKRVSTPVTRKDYESPETASTSSEEKTEPPGGDAG